MGRIIHKKISENLSYADNGIPAAELLMYFGAGCVLSAAIGWLFYHHILGIGICQILPLVFLKQFRKIRIRQQKEQLLFAFKDALEVMSASVFAGRSLESAIRDSAMSLQRIYGEDAGIARAFSQMTRKIFHANQMPEQALMELGIRSGLEDIRNFAEICSICAKTGGNMADAICQAAATITEKIQFRKELHAMTAQKKLEVKILVTIPFLILFFLQTVSYEYISVLYETAQGHTVMTGCLFCIGMAYFWGEKITEIEF